MNKTFLLLDSSMTLHGLRLRVEGGRMERFTSNAIMLYMHVRGVVIGKWENVRMENGGWYADAQFDNDDPDAAKIAGKVERGFLKAASAGVIPLKVEEIDGELWVTEWEMIESSVVDSGSNASALALYTPTGELVEDTKQAIINLTTPIMSEQKKTVPAAAGSEGAAIPAVPKMIALAAGLAEDATEILVAEAITKIVQENKALKLAAQEAEDQSINSLLDEAVKAGKIKDTDRTHYETLAKVNLASVRTIIAGMAVPVNLTAFANSASADGASTPSLKDEYDKLDKNNGLVALKAENPERFKELFKSRFGKDPK